MPTLYGLPTTTLCFQSNVSYSHVTQMSIESLSLLEWFKPPFQISPMKVQCPAPDFWEFPGDFHSHCYFWLSLLLPLMSLIDRLSCLVVHSVPILHHINPDMEPNPSALTEHLLLQGLRSHREFVRQMCSPLHHGTHTENSCIWPNSPMIWDSDDVSAEMEMLYEWIRYAPHLKRF